MTAPEQETPPNSNYRPQDDGITHINVYSKGQTALGRSLSNFAPIGFNHPVHGRFASVEAFWYYAKTGFQHEHLRRLFGYSAKAAGNRLEPVMMEQQAFHDEIRLAITLKIEQHPDVLDALLQNALPLTHYFVYGHGDKQITVSKPEFQWQLDHLNKLREKWIEVA